MAIQTITLELSGRVPGNVLSLTLNGQPALLAGAKYTASVEVPASSTSLTLVATYSDGEQQIRRLLVGEGDVALAGVST